MRQVTGTSRQKKRCHPSDPTLEPNTVFWGIPLREKNNRPRTVSNLHIRFDRIPSPFSQLSKNLQPSCQQPNLQLLAPPQECSATVHPHQWQSCQGKSLLSPITNRLPSALLTLLTADLNQPCLKQQSKLASQKAKIISLKPAYCKMCWGHDFSCLGERWKKRALVCTSMCSGFPS